MQVGVCHVLHLQHASASRHCAMKQTATGEQMASVYSKLIQATFSSLHLKYMTHRETKTIFLLLLDFLIFSSTYRVSEKAKAPHSSTLAWKIPWMEEPGRLQSMGSAKSQTRLKRLSSSSSSTESICTFKKTKEKSQVNIHK